MNFLRKTNFAMLPIQEIPRTILIRQVELYYIFIDVYLRKCWSGKSWLNYMMECTTAFASDRARKVLSSSALNRIIECRKSITSNQDSFSFSSFILHIWIYWRSLLRLYFRNWLMLRCLAICFIKLLSLTLVSASIHE